MAKTTVDFVAASGDVIELTLDTAMWAAPGALYIENTDGTFTMFDRVKPGPNEPTGVGAVVRAQWKKYRSDGKYTLIRTTEGLWMDSDGDVGAWDELENIEIKSEGWNEQN